MSDLKISNLDNLTTKILADAKEKADEIVKNAEVTEKGKYEAGIKKYNAKKVTLQESASRETELTVERIKSGANLKARNEKLEARQKVIDKVIEKLKEKLVNMSEVEYISYIEKNVDRSTLGNKKLIVKQEYLNKVKEVFSGANISENEFVNSGFIVEENGIQENYTFEIKLDFMRDELEVEISKLLFS